MSSEVEIVEVSRANNFFTLQVGIVNHMQFGKPMAGRQGANLALRYEVRLKVFIQPVQLD